jgi:hypothetical protein
MVRFFMNIREFTPSAKLLWKMNAVSSEACGKQRGGTGQEAEQNRQAAAELKQNGQWQQEPGTPMASIYCWVPA